MNDTNKTAHTPGPWSAGPLSKTSGWVDISVGGYPRNPVASATPAGPGGPKERRDSETAANARLIAAAPEMLDALGAVDDAADSMEFDPDSRFGEALARVRARIA